METIYLPKLNRLMPTLESTLLKTVEESGELARAVLHFLPYETLDAAQLAGCGDGCCLLQAVAGELMDVAQTCVTMIFVLEDSCQVHPDHMVRRHLEKLRTKGYGFDPERDYQIATWNNYKQMCLPRLEMQGVSLLTTVCKIQEEMGELTQLLGKHAGASGERTSMDRDEIMERCALELLDIAQCCFTMMYLLKDRYGMDLQQLVEEHVGKLRRKGYCS